MEFCLKSMWALYLFSLFDTLRNSFIFITCIHLPCRFALTPSIRGECWLFLRWGLNVKAASFDWEAVRNYMGGDMCGVKVLLSQEYVDVTLFA